MKASSQIIILFLFSLFLSINSQSQSALDNFTYDVEVIVNDLGMPGLDTLYTLKCIILITEPDSVSNIYIEVGSAENMDDIFNFTFSNSNTQSLPTGAAFLKQGNKFFIVLGDFFDYQYFYEIRLEDLLGNITDPVLLTL